AGNSPVKAMSPGGTQLVFVGNRYDEGRFDYALVVAEWASGRVYAVPFDRTALRFESVWDATPEWIARHFAWTRTPAGAERVRLRAHQKPEPWQGRFDRNAGTEQVEFVLRPTTPEMCAALAAWLGATYGATTVPSPAGSPETPTSRTVAIESATLHLYY